MHVLKELQRRNVFRVGIAYAMSAWVVLQVADLVVEHIDAPSWVMDLLLALVALGFVIALVVSWAYELTPEGLRRDAGPARNESAITQVTARKLDLITLGAVCGVVLLYLLDWSSRPDDGVDRAPASDRSSLTPVAKKPAGPGVDVGPNPSLLPAPLVPADARKRGVAVLPFDSLSVDETNAYFAGGVHDEVLTQLAKVGNLHVISRTSMLRIAERGLDVREIGRELGVSHVLEGSVRRADDQIRVTVQLIDAALDDHVWAETYDRSLDDIFAIQTEIARAIADQLEVELSSEERRRIEAVPTRDTGAYDRYLQALDITRRGGFGREGYRIQVDLLEDAVRRDPAFVEAQVLLGEAYARLVFLQADPNGIYRNRSREIAETLQRGWPDSPEARLARANYRYSVHRDYEAALALYQSVRPSRPNDTDLLTKIAGCMKRLGRFEAGAGVLRQVLLRDPERPDLWSELSLQLAGLDRRSEVMATLEEGMRRFPNSQGLRWWQAHYALVFDGEVEPFIAESGPTLARIPLDVPRVGEGRAFRFLAAWGDKDAVIAQLDQARSGRTPWSDARLDGHVAELLDLDGRRAEARQRADSALARVRANLAAGEVLPGNQPRSAYASFAYLACLADDRASYEAYRDRSEAAEATDALFDDTAALLLVLARAACGDIEEAWRRLPAAQTPWRNFTDWSLVLDPIFRRYFGALPEYRALVRRMTGDDGTRIDAD